MVARSLEKGFAFSLASGEVEASPSLTSLASSDFLPKAKGKEDLRLSDLISGFFSPLTTGAASVAVVSTGTVAGLETSVLKGSVVSGLGMTGAF